MEISAKTRLHYRIQTILFIALFLAVTGLLAWLSTQYSTRSDWTAGNRNSLTDDTIKLLQTLDAPVHVRSYQAEDLNMQQGVQEILGRYRQHKKDFDFRIINPDLEPDLAKADGIAEYGQTVIKYRDQQEIVNALDEQSISNALLRLSRTILPQLAFVSGHGERDTSDRGNTGYALLQQQMTEKGFAFSQINLLRDVIAEDVRVLVIAGASHDFVAGEVDKLLAYLDNGGQLLWLADPESGHSLDRLFAQIGLQMIPGVVVDTNQQLRATLRTPHPAILPVLAYGEHSITAELRYHTLFPMAAAFKTTPAKTEWQATPFLLTLPDSSWAESGNFFLDVTLDKESGDTPGPLAIGYALEKTLAGNHQQRVVVIGDSDFLSNANLGAAANLLLIQNIFNWLAEDDALINISPKAAPDLDLQLNQVELIIIGFGFLIVLPLALAGTGFYIWYKRRAR
ncbi:MAG: transporter [Pseudomonadota bacterium]|nr:transporter [Pseudomonadota bacterium]